MGLMPKINSDFWLNKRVHRKRKLYLPLNENK